jgi:hypothetical protein
LLVLSSFTSDLAEILSSKYPQEFTEWLSVRFIKIDAVKE